MSLDIHKLEYTKGVVVSSLLLEFLVPNREIAKMKPHFSPAIKQEFN